MPDVVFSIDQARPMRDQAVAGHNRWHPDTSPAANVLPGQQVRVECREWTDGQMGNNEGRRAYRWSQQVTST
jgi:formamidase